MRRFVPLQETVMLGVDAPQPRRGAYFAIAALLVEAGADVNGESPAPTISCLQLAVADLEWVEWLLDRGANPDLFDSSAGDRNALPPLYCAVRDGRVAQILRLLSAGARTDTVCDTTKGRLDLLGVAVVFATPNVLTALLDGVHFSPDRLAGAARAAITHNRSDAVSVLCARGARGEARGPDGRLLLLHAYLHRDRHALEALRPHTDPALVAWLERWSRRGVLGVAPLRPASASGPVGAVIGRVVPGSAAAEAGLGRGDVVTQIDNDPVGTFEDLWRLVSARAAGDVVRLTFLREGEVRNVEAVLRPAPFGG